MKTSQKRILGITISLQLTLLALTSLAEPLPTLPLDLSSLPSKSIWGGRATVTPLAFDEKNKPIVVVVRLPAGTVADTAHATSDGRIRFATVLSGTMFYADGEQVNKSKEVAYPTGSILLISSGTKHWLSARKDNVVIMLTGVSPEAISPIIKTQLLAGKAKATDPDQSPRIINNKRGARLLAALMHSWLQASVSLATGGVYLYRLLAR